MASSAPATPTCGLPTAEARANLSWTSTRVSGWVSGWASQRPQAQERAHHAATGSIRPWYSGVDVQDQRPASVPFSLPVLYYTPSRRATSATSKLPSASVTRSGAAVRRRAGGCRHWPRPSSRMPWLGGSSDTSMRSVTALGASQRATTRKPSSYTQDGEEARIQEEYQASEVEEDAASEEYFMSLWRTSKELSHVEMARKVRNFQLCTTCHTISECTQCLRFGGVYVSAQASHGGFNSMWLSGSTESSPPSPHWALRVGFGWDAHKSSHRRKPGVWVQ